METEVFEELMVTVLVGGLILFMAFIVWHCNISLCGAIIF